MKRTYHIYIQLLFVLFAFLVIGASCSKEDEDRTKDNGVTFITVSLKALSTSINEDNVFWEDRVDELRMIVFNSSNGTVALNRKLDFPNGFADRSEAVAMQPGIYDFYFIANESVYSGDFTSSLASITGILEFRTNPVFRFLQYNPSFVPDASSQTGRFLMSAIYNKTDVDMGGTKENPAPLILPTNEVELIRSLAKVEVIFRKKTTGSTIPANTISSVQLVNVAANLSVPPVDNYYKSAQTVSRQASLSGFDYSRDSIGSALFYIPELLAPEGGSDMTELQINNKSFPIENDGNMIGITFQRRDVPALSNNSVIRNYHYIVNVYIDSQGGIQLEVSIKPWRKDEYSYVFQGDKTIVVPPVIPTDSSVIIIPVLCDGISKIEILGREEILPQGLQGAYGDQINYWDPVIQGPTIIKGNPPYYCEKKYGEGWRLINSCELMSFLALFDQAYRIWQSNTWEGVNSGLPFYPLPFRQDAQDLLGRLTGEDMSVYHLSDNGKDVLGDVKLGVIDKYFTPGDIMLKEEDFSNGWPFSAPPMNNGQKWYPSEVVVQVNAYWYPGYLDLSVPGNKEKVLYQEFQRYDYSSTVSRCVRTVE